MGAGARGIGVNRRWPCVGDPGSDVMYACGAEGSLSLMTIVPAGMIQDLAEDDPAGNLPMVVHLTVCPQHVRAARNWLEMRTIGDPVDTWSTSRLMAEWGQVERHMEGTPIYRLQAV